MQVHEVTLTTRCGTWVRLFDVEPTQNDVHAALVKDQGTTKSIMQMATQTGLLDLVATCDKETEILLHMVDNLMTGSVVRATRVVNVLELKQ